MTRYTGQPRAAKASLLLICLMWSGFGCWNPTSSRQSSQDTQRPRSGLVDNKALYDDIFNEESGNYCRCTTSEEVDYYFDHPDEFRKCTELKIINEQVDCDLFKRILKMKHITWLNFGDFTCEEIPEEVLKAHHLTSLSINVPPSWKKIPSILFRIPNLTDLGFGGDNLSVFEDDIPVNSKLEDMDFYYSPIEEVPMIFAKFPKLMRLNIGTPEHPIKNVKAFRELRPDISFSSNEFD